MDCIGIKVPETASVLKCVAVLRKLLPLQISEIKRRIENREYLFLGSFVDMEEVDLALSICRSLAHAGIEVECYEHSEYFDVDRPYSIEDLENWSKSCHDIESD
jgi:hypothetical protein